MASTYLNKTFGSAGDRQTWTWSGWVKKANVGGDRFEMFSGGTGSTDTTVFELQFKSDTIRIVGYTTVFLQTNAVYRDLSSWYHVVLEFDVTQATASDRMKLYVNGEEVTSFSTDNRSSLTQNTDHGINQSALHTVGRYSASDSFYFDGEMAHIHFIDGTAYDADTFGETDSTTGEWKPKTSPSVTYGTNGFFLKFENASSFGEDSSGNNNDFTSNGSPTQNVDTPANILATMNPLVPTASLAFSNGNTTLTGSNDTLFSSNNNSTLGVSAGKWYAEVEYDTAGGNTNPTVGITPITTSATTNTTGSVTDAVVIRMDNDLYVEGSSTSSYLGSTPSAGDIIGIALDLDNGKVWFSLNGTFVGDPVAGTGAAFDGITSGEIMCFCTRALGAVFKWNFGNGYFGTTAVTSGNQDDAGYGTFEYDVPTGYYTLNTKNINTYG